jgi:hypothetical protein
MMGSGKIRRIDVLKRLMAVDAALAGDGFVPRELAKKLGVSRRTILRDRELLITLSGDNGVYISYPEDGHYRWWYSDPKHRVFSEWVARKMTRKRK